MTIQRIITDVPAADVPFVLAMIAADGGRVLSQEPEGDGEFTITAEFPGPAGAAPAALAAGNAAAAAPAAAVPVAAAPGIEVRWMALARQELGQAEDTS